VTALLKRAKKAVAAAAGTAALLVSAGVLDDQAEAIANVIIALATVAGVYQLKNEPVPGRIDTEV
jgi:tRNA C32,U32 (ribose-2'-O)-methylase TrmJ